MTSSPSVQLLGENSPDVFLGASEVLLRLANNILKSPDNPKYRRIRVGNPLIQEKLLPVSGGMECLFEMGFQEDGEYLTLPQHTLLDLVKQVRDALETQCKRLGASQSAVQNGASPGLIIPSRQGASAAVSSSNSAPGHETLQSPNAPSSMNISQAVSTMLPPVPQPQHIMASQLAFLRKLQTSSEHVLMYEDPLLQEKARSCMKLGELRDKASQRLSDLAKDGTVGLGIEDTLVLELLAWFKHRFFKWVDQPPCVDCGGKTQMVGMVDPNPTEHQWLAERVEQYQCTGCGQYTRFPRYNHPGMLLETRHGRCGEWANCFTLCCRAARLEARYVLDWTDHVWTEVFSPTQKRWLHCDPCENVCDKPLLYEAGWGKKLSYIIAFSSEDVQDVTWRYSAIHQEVLSRRHACSEQWLVGAMLRLRTHRQKSLNESRRQELLDRTVAELVELMDTREAGEGETTGRTTGSLAWRLARGEVGSNPQASPPPQQTVIHLLEQEKSSKMLHLCYNCSLDQYCRPSAGEQKVTGWNHMTYEVKDLFRKEENDWKIVYLARTEGAALSSITWKFDFSDSGLEIATVDIQALSTRFEDGKIMWRLCSDETCAFLPPDGTQTVFQEFQGCTVLTLTAHLQGGKGDVAWQHTQLFRQKMDDDAQFPFNVKITFKEK